MKRIVVNGTIGFLLVLISSMMGFNGSAEAATFEIGLSPPAGGALNLGATTYTIDHAVFGATANETAQPASPATGNEVGTGITYDDVTKVLTFDFAYGAGFGFTDLLTAFTDVHFHAPGPVNFPAVNTSSGVIHALGGFHTPSGTLSGHVTGTVVLTAGQETDLFDNEIYLNIHSVGNGPGEIRAQLIPVTTGFFPVELQSFSVE